MSFGSTERITAAQAERFGQIKAGRWAEARTHLDAVTNQVHAIVKARLERNWREKQGLPLGTVPSNGPESPVGNGPASPAEKP